jgi:hypothetical protein
MLAIIQRDFEVQKSSNPFSAGRPALKELQANRKG